MQNSLHFPTLEIDLTAIARNYALLAGKLATGRCAAVVKANAYGLGVVKVAPVFHGAGCRDFFVATLDEAIQLRGILPDATIYVFHGARQGQGEEFTSRKLIPVLNSPYQIECWNNAGPAALHIDTGMCRLGLCAHELEKLTVLPQNLQLILSHLACANEPENPKNAEQLASFRAALAKFKGTPASFSNSSGIFLGSDYHFDIARPGCALYGISRSTSRPNPMENVVTLSAPVLQYRTLTRDETVGYSATATAKKGSVLATVEIGYADGLIRSLSNKGCGYAHGVATPIVGRVSMDMVSVDVSKVPEQLRTPEMRITFIGTEQPVDIIATCAGTIGYEILTGMDRRIKRIYR